MSEGTQEHCLAASSFRIREFHPLRSDFPAGSASLRRTVVAGPTTPPQKPGMVWAIPRSLAATYGVSIDFLSSGYLDVSVPRVGSSCEVTRLCAPGFPIRTSSDHRVLARSPRLFAGSYVLHRLLLPRHPPCALSSLFSPDSARYRRAGLSLRSTQRLPYPYTQCERTEGVAHRSGRPSLEFR